MKKITLTIFSLILFGGTLFSQTNSTGQVEFMSIASGTPYGAQIDVTASVVTLTFIGPINRWLGIGFGVNSMTAGEDVVMFDGTNLTDRTFLGIGQQPQLDTATGGSSDWTIISTDTTSSPGFIGVVAVRALSTGDTSDYVFNLTDTSINLVWAMGPTNTTSQQHTFRGITSAGFTLGVEDFSLSEFKISPNPVSTDFSIALPNAINNATVEVFDVLGKTIYSSEISSFNSVINVSNWNNGIYLVRVSSDNVSHTKRIIKQ